MKQNITLNFEAVTSQLSPHRRRYTLPTTFDGCLIALASTQVADEPFFSTVDIYVLPDATFQVHHRRYSVAVDDQRCELLPCHNIGELLRTLCTLDLSLQQRYNESFREWTSPLSFTDDAEREESLTCSS